MSNSLTFVEIREIKGHSAADMQAIILEKINASDGAFRKEREKLFINLLNTSYKGMNRKL